MNQIKNGKYTSKNRGEDNSKDPKEKQRKILDLVDNIDSNAEKARNIKLTKIEFIDSLR